MRGLRGRGRLLQRGAQAGTPTALNPLDLGRKIDPRASEQCASLIAAQQEVDGIPESWHIDLTDPNEFG